MRILELTIQVEISDEIDLTELNNKASNLLSIMEDQANRHPLVDCIYDTSFEVIE